ncbi:S4A5 electrogenic sodium bicarbonate cotransporter 4 [Raoultibacter phocaeensis]|uniref:S4A5 electrogenic sodium bicarbonate cotransporter 4 n=1 Tax=Raoultibacter phocaeensis TaxID=2479841 RepID=UPI0021042D7A|nr:S4A5 electrogenic sodium bicarbonate cotransporter 4 [Raoultibacter phocaeensis]
MSLLTLVIVLCLATMAVLSVSTAQATFAATERQASFTDDTYKNETAAQRFVAGVDGVLNEVRSGQRTGTSSIAAIAGELPALAASVSEDGVAAQASIEGAVVHATFSTESGRSLEIELTVKNGRTYEITQWKATTQWNEEGGGETLWSPSA